jgi:hypothetical protein
MMQRGYDHEKLHVLYSLDGQRTLEIFLQQFLSYLDYTYTRCDRFTRKVSFVNGMVRLKTHIVADAAIINLLTFNYI